MEENALELNSILFATEDSSQIRGRIGNKVKKKKKLLCFLLHARKPEDHWSCGPISLTSVLWLC